MAFDFSTLEPQIYQILSAPGTDLTTISAKRVRRQLVELEPSLTSEYLKENKDQVDAVIASVFEQVSAAQQAGGSQASEELPLVNNAESRKRKQNDNDSGDVKEEEDGDEEVETPPPKKAKKAGKNGREISDAELARKLSSEINSRSRRTADKPRRATNVAAKKGSKARKSAATVDSDDDSDDGGSKKKAKPKKRNTDGSGGAKGGFAKEYDLSEPLAAVLQVHKLSRPQVVKQLWVYIKEKELQNPANRREIMCDENLRAVFNVDKIDMFKMNKVLGSHLHENEG